MFPVKHFSPSKTPYTNTVFKFYLLTKKDNSRMLNDNISVYSDFIRYMGSITTLYGYEYRNCPNHSIKRTTETELTGEHLNFMQSMCYISHK